MRRVRPGLLGLLALVSLIISGSSAVGAARGSPIGVPSPAQTPVGSPSGRVLQGAIDQRFMSAPARDTIYSCMYARMGEARTVSWVSADGMIDLDRKPVVPGEVTRDTQGLSVEPTEVGVWLSGDGLPVHATGIYPVPPDSEAYQYDRNPNSIRARDWVIILPSEPQLAAEPSCLPMGPIGAALTGAFFFNALDAGARDAVANELFDLCEGHPEVNGQYHYHHDSPCFAQGDPTQHAPLAGYAFDGIGIYGARDADGHLITNAELDECHGHVGLVPREDGEVVLGYHYHLNGEFPYSLGCFRGAEIARFPPGPPRP